MLKLRDPTVLDPLASFARLSDQGYLLGRNGALNSINFSKAPFPSVLDTLSFIA